MCVIIENFKLGFNFELMIS